MLRLFLALLGALAVCGEDEDGASPGEAFDEIKCSACCSIVAELERNLETEKPRMNVDLRRTLAGQDKGKVVDYAVSELRTLEVMESVCPRMHDYGVTRVEGGRGFFQRHSVAAGTVHISGSMTIGGDHYTWDKRALRSYCDELLEAHEDPLAEAIKAAGLANLKRREEDARAAAARRMGLSEDADASGAADHYATLGLDAATASRDDVKRAFRARSRDLHPDKTGGDPASMRAFVAVANAYEALSGEAHRPYDDLYRQVCVDIARVCDTEADVDAAKAFFPHYVGSTKFPEKKKDAAPTKKRKRKKKSQRRDDGDL